MKRTNLSLVLIVGLLLLGSWAAAQAAVPASLTLTVTGYGDFSDLNPGDGHCDAIAALPGDQCSLRAAIEELNATGPGSALHHINFDIAVGTGPFTITPGSELPPIQVPVKIDGSTQPGASCPTANDQANLLIVLDGSNAGAAALGLQLDRGQRWQHHSRPGDR